MRIFLVFVGVAFAVAFGDDSAQTHPTIGGTSEPTVEEVKNITDLLSSNLARLVSGDGTSLEIVTIKKISKQVVAGMKYEITGTFKRGTKTSECFIILWHRSWLEDVNEKVKLRATCEGEAIQAKNDDGSW